MRRTGTWERACAMRDAQIFRIDVRKRCLERTKNASTITRGARQIRRPGGARALRVACTHRFAALMKSARSPSTNGNHTTIKEMIDGLDPYSNVLCRQAQIFTGGDRRPHRKFVSREPDAWRWTRRTAHSVATTPGPRKWSCASAGDMRRCVPHLCHWLLLMQKLEPSESCVDPVFCMRLANLTSRADVTSTCAILSREHANLGFEADLPQKIGFFRGRIGVTNQ